MAKKRTTASDSGSPDISQLLAKTLNSLSDKELKKFPAGEDIPAGTYSVDETFRVVATVVKAAGDEPDARFDYGSLVRDVLLMYTSSIPNGADWLRWLFGLHGDHMQRLHHDVRKQNCETYINPELAVLWDELENDAKDGLRRAKTKRAGATSVQGQFELIPKK